MNSVEVYVSKAMFYEGKTLIAAEPEVSFNTIEYKYIRDWIEGCDIRVARSSEPTVTVALPAGWVASSRDDGVTVFDEEGRQIPPRVLMVWAMHRRFGLRIVRGVCPFETDQTEAEILTRRRSRFQLEV